MNLAINSHSLIPFWVKIHNVPLKRRLLKGISMMASEIGRPLHVDPMTKDRTRLGYVKICVEVSVSSKFSKFISIYQGIDEFSREPWIFRLPIEY